MPDHTQQTRPDHLASAIDYVCQLRTDWPRAAVEAAVEACRNHRDRPADDLIARSFVKAAADIAVRKPRYVPAARYWVTLDLEAPATLERGAGLECRACGQPGSAGNPPKFCPACGSTWHPVTPSGADPDDTSAGVRCSSCGSRQRGRFPHCATCGALMAYPRPAARPDLR